MTKAFAATAEKSIASLLTEALDGFSRLAAEHVRLARLEFKQDLKTQGRHIATMAMAASFALIGYLLICVGLGLVIAQWVGLATAFLLVCCAHLVIGAFTSFIALRRLQAMNWMHGTISELDRSVSSLAPKVAKAESRAAASLRNGTASQLPEVHERANGRSHLVDRQ